MHDIDRTQLEAWEADAVEAEPFEFADTETYGFAPEVPFDEAEEMELASALLEITDEAELDQFLGSLFKKVGGFLKKPFRALGGILKGVAKKALPVLGGALGSFIPIPGVGTAMGTALGSAASRIFELELEGLTPEDQEFEVARRFVRLAGAAAKQLAAAPPTADPQAAAKAALMAAARQHAPGLVQQAPPPSAMTGGRGYTGRWIRRGRKIILLGV